MDISYSFPTATAALSLRAGLSIAYLSYFPDPPQELPQGASNLILSFLRT